MRKSYTHLAQEERYQKKRIGDWEADTVIGKGLNGIQAILSERVSKLNLIAQVVTQARIEMLISIKMT